MLQKLPIGIQTFSQIREDNYIYIDKTKEAYELITNYKYAFLSRPRRFGKSLFLDTLRNIFEGKKEFFEGLYIYDKWDWSKKYPVIKISWGGKLRTIEDLEQKLRETLLDNQKRLGIECENDISLPICFERLIKEAYSKYKQRVVVLIDEYDKPILDVIEDINQAREHREYIKGLYSILKESDEYLQFAFLTGVSKFSKASIFSGLNMLTDISLDEEYGNICGYTQNDLEICFKEYLNNIDLERVKQWYNGYYFLKDKIYNPFDILQLFAKKGKFKNYWFSTGTPTFLIKLIEQNNYFLPKLSSLRVGEELLDSFDIDNIKLEVILYQSGYLTIDEAFQTRRGMEYKVKLPNEEVKISFFDYVIDYLTNQQSDRLTYQDNLYDALANGNLEEFKDTLINLFASIPYNNYTNNKIYEYEGFYASVVYSYLQSLGLDIIGEDVTNLGRIDLTLFIEDKLYIIEFKVADEGEGRREKVEESEKLKVENESSNSALKQIKEKRYYQKYQKPETNNQKLTNTPITSNQSTIYLIGIEFCKSAKNICSFAWEEV